MEIITTASQLRRARAGLSGSVAFVPTMGFLHEGHLELMRQGLQRCDHLIVSIFVNPTQFGPGEDLDAYPRDMEGDREKCRKVGCDILYTPHRDDLYPDGHTTRVVVDELGEGLCGPGRPGHFDGVSTIVAKFFNIVSPDVAVFGQKDAQQLAVIRRMVADLDFPIDIIGVPTHREKDGLAMSSRNRYLDAEQRRQATALSRGLVAAQKAFFEDGERRPQALVDAARAVIEAQEGAVIDYVECVRADRLTPFDGERIDDKIIADVGVLLAMAVFFGSARLIDNLRLDRPLPQGPLGSVKCSK